MRNKFIRVMLGVAFAFAFVPSAALASSQTAQPVLEVSDEPETVPAPDGAEAAPVEEPDGDEVVTETAEPATPSKTDYVIPYDRSLIEAIGTQESTGHTICCPSFSCAYADAVMDGTVHDHDYYTCSCCTWTDWGGGNSSFRCVGSDEELLREAYDQITQGKPTVIHVAANYGEHWIALIGYQGATDPNHLTLGNFIALDPWDGSQIVAGDNFALYGDGCEHISDR